MRTFFEGLGEKLGMTAEMVSNKAGEAVELVGNKAGEALELQKLKGQIRTLEKSNESDLADIGRLIYEKFKAGDALEDELVGICEAIQNREESIAEYQQKMSDVKGDVACERCGKMLAKGMAYCPYCGEKTPEEEDEESIFAEGEIIVEDMADKAEEMAETAADKAEEVVEDIADGVKDAAEKAADFAEETVEKVEDAVEKAAETVKDTLE